MPQLKEKDYEKLYLAMHYEVKEMFPGSAGGKGLHQPSPYVVLERHTQLWLS